MNCKTCRTEIEDLKLVERLSDETQAHLEECPACTVFLREQESLKRLVGDLQTVSAPADFDLRLRARIAAAESASQRRFINLRFAPGALPITLAACFAVAVAIALYFQQLRPSNPTANQTPVERVAALSPSPFSSPQNNQLKEDLKPEVVNTVINQGVGKAKAITLPRRRLTPVTVVKILANREEDANRLVDSTSSSVRAAQVIRSLASSSGTKTEPDIPIAVPASARSMKVLLRDAQGVESLVTIKPVSFGGQEFVASDSSAKRTSFTDSQGIW